MLHSYATMKKAGLSLLFVVAPSKEQEMRTALTPTTFLVHRASLMQTALPPIITILLMQRFHLARMPGTH